MSTRQPQIEFVPTMATEPTMPHTSERADDPPPMLAKIVATIGPSSESPEMVRKLIEAGVSIFRFNFSHGDFAGHKKRLDVVREVAAQLDRPIAALGDLQGPKIRVGKVPEGGIMLSAGQDVCFKLGLPLAYVDPANAAQPVAYLPTTYEPLVREVLPGHKVLINDGAIRMLAVSSDSAAGELRCRVTVGGLVTSGKGINLPQSAISAPAITDRDWECVAWAVEHGLDFLALSFVRKAEEVLELKRRLGELGSRFPESDPRYLAQWMPVVAKIEKPQAVANISSIVAAADAIMVARGDLGVEMEIARVPVAQKEIVACCASHGKPCIVATQMLETMIDNASPTRAEASDVANAIFDGADAVMLSAETATGKHPALVVETMSRIVRVAESSSVKQSRGVAPPTHVSEAHRDTAALAHGAAQVARDLKAPAIVCWSENAGTARYISQNEVHMPIIAYSSNSVMARRMAILGGVIPVCAKPPVSGHLAEWNEGVDELVIRRGLAKRGDPLVLVAGHPLGQAKATNRIAIHRVGEPTGFRTSKS
ncbi:MAG: pyruvate kinase [Phycisphaerales bacterium]|nr:pyruvate kinase [Phycisphaerales bacterium]